MHHHRGFTFIELITVIFILGILALMAIPNYIRMQNRAKESQVKNNAHTLQLVVEDYAVQHEGVYSDVQADLLPLMPNGTRLVNAFTSGVTEPQFGVAATTPGQIGLVGVVDGGRTTGYRINGWGLSQEILVLVGGR